MPPNHLTLEARAENAQMLASILGLDTVGADEALQFDVSVTANANDSVAVAIATELVSILGRTVRGVTLNRAYETARIEVVIGSSSAQTPLEKLYVGVSAEQAVIGDHQDNITCAMIPAIFGVVVACYACAAVMQRVFKDRLPLHVPSPLVIPFAQFGVDFDAVNADIDLGRTYLAGAGAIGNGFLWAARHLNIRGQLDIADDDRVSSGNLNRQMWFTRDDINKSKAERLALHAQPYFPSLKLEPRTQRLQELSERSDGPWLKRVIVAVDSRRARRKIQNEFPGEVFDASTTDIREIVVHYHKQPTETACLSCIYEPDQEEMTREAHIADHLDVSVEEVRAERISDDAADRIVKRYPKLEKSLIVGSSYDTLFKQLCGQGDLKTLEGRRIIAPFAFVSVLAGTLLALEVVRRVGKGHSSKQHNYWRISPWHPPLVRKQILRPRQTACEFCGNPTLVRVNSALWNSDSR
jgi:molybdopterin/thiamine biosynthesis adenylyltransferase